MIVISFFVSLYQQTITIKIMKKGKTMSECKMLGYYYDLEDIKLYVDKSADEIVADFLNGKGTIVYENDFVELYFGSWNVEVTTDGKYAVVKDINYCDNLTDFEKYKCYIDIYKLL